MVSLRSEEPSACGPCQGWWSLWGCMHLEFSPERPWLLPLAFIVLSYLRHWNDPVFHEGKTTGLKCNKTNRSVKLPKSQLITKSYMNIRVQIERFTPLFSLPRRAKHTQSASWTASEVAAERTSPPWPNLSAEWTPTPTSRCPRRTRAQSLPKIYQYSWYWPRIAHIMLVLLCGKWMQTGK
jgi:hypothetical protein